MCIYMYICIYVERERERADARLWEMQHGDAGRGQAGANAIRRYKYTYIYIYIYTYRERADARLGARQRPRVGLTRNPLFLSFALSRWILSIAIPANLWRDRPLENTPTTTRWRTACAATRKHIYV